jgi:hypothetical protein
MYYTYDKTAKGPTSWIDYLQTITDLEIVSLGRFMIKEVHFTKPKKPATSKKDWVNLPHITIENISGKKIHWYIWNKAVDRNLRIEEMMGTKKQEYNTNQGELELINKVIGDIKEQGWV